MAKDEKAAAKSHTATFVREKETKNTVRFNEEPAEGVAPIIGNLYVAKHVAGAAEKLEVTIAIKG